jgi:hypothetical protein
MADGILTFSGQQYAIDSLSESAQALCSQVRFCDEKLAQLRAEIAVFELARDVAVNSLRAQLPATPVVAESEAEAAPKKKTTRKKVH